MHRSELFNLYSLYRVVGITPGFVGESEEVKAESSSAMGARVLDGRWPSQKRGFLRGGTYPKQPALDSFAKLVYT
jgi:hypothetical protein